MGLEYALVHIKYTIPPAILLTLLYRPLFTRRDVYRIFLLVTIAVVSTIPWDSYLIRHRIWTYPDHAVLGPTLFQIPIEELFFFVIQTYDVSLLYLIYTKSTYYPAYLQHPDPAQDQEISGLRKTLHSVVEHTQITLLVRGGYLLWNGDTGTYMGLILSWAFPIICFLWIMTRGFMLRIPASNIVFPIVLPTIYLWIVDTFSLRRGTWVIEQGTKWGVHLWDGLEIEEATFFLVTNILIVYGQVAFDNAVTVIDTFQDLFPTEESCPSLLTAIEALRMPLKRYDGVRLTALKEAVQRLQKKSRSFFLANAVFEGRLRTNLILLVADDIVDTSESPKVTQMWIDCLHRYLDLAYSCKDSPAIDKNVFEYVLETFPEEAQYALLQLPVRSLSKEPLYDLLKGFEMDLHFASSDNKSRWPISDERFLKLYGEYVAGTVAELCCDLMFYHYGKDIPISERQRLKKSARNMGVALQTVNIARDFKVDAAIGRVYIPTIWLTEANLSPQDILDNPERAELRSRLISKAFEVYNEARPALDELPVQAKGGMKVAIESYMEIGRVLRDETYVVRKGRSTVPVPRRIWVAWQTLNR